MMRLGRQGDDEMETKTGRIFLNIRASHRMSPLRCPVVKGIRRLSELTCENLHMRAAMTSLFVMFAAVASDYTC